MIDESTRLALQRDFNHKSVPKIVDVLMFPLGCTWEVHDGPMVGLHFLNGFIDSGGCGPKSDDGKALNARNKFWWMIVKLGDKWSCRIWIRDIVISTKLASNIIPPVLILF